MKTGPRFLTTLATRRASDGQAGAWQLTAPLIYVSDILLRPVVVPEGFRSDFASVPRVPVAYWLFGGAADEAAVVHDWLYTSNVTGVTREQADNVFAEASKVLGIAAWRRGPMWAAIRLFGGSHWGTGTPLAAEAVVAEDAAEAAD